MQFSAILAFTMALGACAAPLPSPSPSPSHPREPSGRLALRSVVRPDDIVVRDTLSVMQRGHITRLHVSRDAPREAF